MEHYVLVQFPEDTSYFEENEIGYPSWDSEDNSARYVPEEEYIKVFVREPPLSQIYKVIDWPESQELMEDPELDSYAETVQDEKGMIDFICPAYWIPINK